jgi:hypothetical protein
MDQVVYGEAPLRTERVGGALLWVTVVAVGGFAIACIALALWHALNDAPSAIGGLLGAVLFIMAAGAAAAIWFTLHRAVTVYGDRIEAANGFSTTTLRRSEIKGYRRLRGDLVNLVPRDEFSKPLRISAALLRDPLTQKWFAGLQDLDATTPQPAIVDDGSAGAASADIAVTDVTPAGVAPADAALADVASGDAAPADNADSDDAAADDAPARTDPDALQPDETPAPGQQAELTQLAWIASGAGVAVGIWVAFSPEPHALAVLANVAAMAAGIAMKLYFGPLISIASDRNHTDPRPSISLLFAAPAIALLFRATQDFEILDSVPAIISAGIMALALGAFLIAHDRRLQSSMAIGVFLILGLFFFGALTEINAIFDAAPPVAYRTSIAGLYTRDGRSTSYHVQLGLWGEQHGGEDVTVSGQFYSAHAIGETICVTLSQGWLGMRYYNIGDCRS